MVGWWLFASLMNEYIYSLSTFHNKNMSSINLFNTSGLCGLLSIISVSIADITMLANATASFVRIAAHCTWRQFFSNKLERILPQDQSRHICVVLAGYWRFVLTECFVCFAYNGNSFLLQDVCVQASYIHRDQNSIFCDPGFLYEVDKVCRIFKMRFLRFSNWLDETINK